MDEKKTDVAGQKVVESVVVLLYRELSKLSMLSWILRRVSGETPETLGGGPRDVRDLGAVAESSLFTVNSSRGYQDFFPRVSITVDNLKLNVQPPSDLLLDAQYPIRYTRRLTQDMLVLE